MEKIVIFGASLGGERALRTLSRGQRAIAFCDNSRAKHGTQFQGLPVIAPEKIRDSGCDRVLIASSYFEQIYDQLAAMGLPAGQLEVVEAHVLEGKPDRETSPQGFYLAAAAAAAVILLLAGYGLYRLVFG